MEPNRGNLYEPHYLQINSGTFWRCKHGSTGYKSGLIWKGCWRCLITHSTHKLWNKIKPTHNK